MSYQVLARKWRPKSFRSLVGQEHVLKALVNALDQDRLHHAYLFTGTRGVGKTTIARILAKCLNCEAGVSSEPCGTCSACNEINEGRFVDLIEVDAASRTKVEDTRELLDNVQYAPTRARYKIYLIDEVHMLSNHSFNALLKTLEEPPEHVKFLLATTDPQKLPVTILSRCLQFNLKNMSPERIVGHLQHVLEKEMVPFEESALWLLARAADGSMRDALSLTDQAIAYGGSEVVERDVSLMLGTIEHKMIETLVQALAAEDAKQLLAAVAAFSEHAPDYDAALSDLLALLHRIAVAQTLPEAVDNSFGDRSQILAFARLIAPEDIQLFYQIALVGRRDLTLASDLRSGFEMTLLRMLAFKPQGVVDIPNQPLASDGQSSTLSDDTASSKTSPGHPLPSQTLSESPQEEVPSVKKSSSVPPRPVARGESAAAHHDRPIDFPAESEHERVSDKPDTPAQHKVDVEPKAEVKPQVTVDSGPSAEPKSIEPVARASIPTEAPRPRLPAGAVPIADGKRAGQCAGATEPTLALEKEKISLDQFANENWPVVFERLDLRGLVRNTLSNTVLIACRESRCEFILDERKASLYDANHLARLEQLLALYFGEKISAHIRVAALPPDTESPSVYADRKQREKQAKALASLHADPVVQTLESEFAGQLDPASVEFDGK